MMLSRNVLDQPSPRRRGFVVAVLATLLVLGTDALVPLASTAAPSLGQLNSQLGSQQARAQSLSASVSSVSRLIASLDGQIALVQSRQAARAAELGRDRAALGAAQANLARERRLLRVLATRLAQAREALARQLVSGYEGDKPDLVLVVLEARGFTDLLERVDFLQRAERQQQALIGVTRVAKVQAGAAARRLAGLEATDRSLTSAAALQAGALAGMNALLQSRQGALQHARAAQAAALEAAHARGSQLQNAISRLQAQQAAAQQTAGPTGTGAGPATGTTGTGPAPTALGPSGGWAIPYSIVLCESGGQNLPPNGAGASGYYQIIPSTWSGFGGSGPAAYLASKAEQDAVATRIWNGGAGASNWVCAGIVGIH